VSSSWAVDWTDPLTIGCFLILISIFIIFEAIQRVYVAPTFVPIRADA
jgi:hypothetical protein